VLPWVKHATEFLVLALSAYVGFGNTDDIANTITVWQRLVGVTATVTPFSAWPPSSAIGFGRGSVGSAV